MALNRPWLDSFETRENEKLKSNIRAISFKDKLLVIFYLDK